MGRKRSYDVRLLAMNENWAGNGQICASHTDPYSLVNIQPDVTGSIAAECRRRLQEQGVPGLSKGCELIEADLAVGMPTDAVLRAFRKWGNSLFLVHSNAHPPRAFWLPPQLRALATNERGPIPRQAESERWLQRFVVEQVYDGKVAKDASRCRELAAAFEMLTGAVKGLQGLPVREPRADALENRLSRLTECSLRESEVAKRLIRVLRDMDQRQERQAAAVAKSKERLLAKREEQGRVVQQLRAEKRELTEELKQLRFGGGRLDRAKRGLLPENKGLQVGQEFVWPTKSFASKLDAAMQEHMQKERELCRPRRFKLVTSEHVACVGEGGKRRAVRLGLGLVACEPLKVNDALFVYDGRWYFGEEAIREGMGPQREADGRANRDWAYCLEPLHKAGVIIDGHPSYGNVAGYINSSRNVTTAATNCAFTPVRSLITELPRTVVIVVTREVEPGCELFADYEPLV
jgi:hypothetical protein